MKQLSLGFSPCPNDTFIFNHLVKRSGENSGIEFMEPSLEDVETLNRWALESRLDVTKISFHALGHVLDEYCVLQSGSALGRGCGPLLVAAAGTTLEDLTDGSIAVPGTYTTAAVLFRMFRPESRNLVEMRFEQIMDSINRGDVAAGVIIHESRFTYHTRGLICLQDLGQWWEKISGLPIPLGCIAARRNLGPEILSEIDNQIKVSLEKAFSDPQQCMDYIRRNAQETDERIIKSHIKLYVNEFSLTLGQEGRAAIEVFLSRGRGAGILPEQKHPVFCSGK